MSDTNGQNPMRIVLVGAEPSRDLRADETVELVRVRSAVDAVAELASPLDPLDHGARRIVALAEGAIDEDDAPRFLAAAREADPDAFVVLWRRDASRPINGLARGFDGVVEGPLTRDSLDKPPTNDMPPANPAPSDRAPDRPVYSGTTPTPGEGDLARESADLEAILTGADTLEAFLGALRLRLADPTLRFVEDPAKAPRDGASVTVERRGAAFGALCSTRLNERALADASVWLARRMALAEQIRQLREAALTDPLTGAYNRRFFDRYLPHAIDQARARRLEAHLLLIDIDNFKRFNDEHGHPAGDDILLETARMLKSVVRPGDKVCRIGGDEFAVIFFEPEGPREPSGGKSQPSLSLSKVAARIQRVVCEKRFPKLGHDAPGQLSVSGGMATFPWDAVDAPSLIARADQLALESKRAGKSVITLGPGSRACLER
jgi:diguanylate cyclase (GGDEF)-like protein